MTLDYSIKGQVTISMKDYIDKMTLSRRDQGDETQDTSSRASIQSEQELQQVINQGERTVPHHCGIRAISMQENKTRH